MANLEGNTLVEATENQTMNFEIFSLALDKSANAACKILCISSLENSINLRSQNSTSHKTFYFHQTAQNNEELGKGSKKKKKLEFSNRGGRGSENKKKFQLFQKQCHST